MQTDGLTKFDPNQMTYEMSSLNLRSGSVAKRFGQFDHPFYRGYGQVFQYR